MAVISLVYLEAFVSVGSGTNGFSVFVCGLHVKTKKKEGARECLMGRGQTKTQKSSYTKTQKYVLIIFQILLISEMLQWPVTFWQEYNWLILLVFKLLHYIAHHFKELKRSLNYLNLNLITPHELHKVRSLLQPFLFHSLISLQQVSSYDGNTNLRLQS